MTENPKQDILVAPEFSILEFGDGYLALIQGGHEETDNDEVKVVEFMIKPSDLLRKRYDIKDSMLNQNGVLSFRVAKNDLIPLNLFDDSNKKWLYIKTLNHEETEISKIGWDLRQKVQEMQKQLIITQGDNIWLSEQLQIAKTRPAEFITQGAEIYERFIPKIADALKGKMDKEQ